MPYVVTCPSCSTRLKTPNPVPAGRAVTCPQCEHAFTTTDVSPELADTGTAPALARPPVPPPPPKKAKQEELVAAEIVDDDEDDRPRAKKRRDEDDEDDRPRAKKRRDDDEDDDRPRAKKRRDDDDEDDDRPPTKKRSRDEDEDDLPASRRKGAKKTKSKLVLILAIALPLLFLMVVGAGVGAYFLFFGGGPSSDMLAWAPSDTTSVQGVNYSKINGIPSMKRTASGQLSRIENLGVSLDNIDEALMATGPGGEAVVVRTKSSLDPAVLMKVARATEKTANGKKYYQAPSGYFHVPSGRLLVFCPGETTMTELLRKDAKVTISDELRGYVNKAGGDIWEANVNTGNIGVNGFFPRPKAAYGGVSITGNYIKITRTSIYADANAARTAEKVLQMDIKVMTSGSGKRIDSTDVTVSGTTVTLKVAGFFENDGSDFSGFRGF